MKTRISTAMRSAAMLWIVALLFVATSAQAQDAFEGRIIQTITIPQMGDEKMEMVMNVKGEKMMINMDMGPAGQMKMLTQNGGKSMVMIMEQMKMGYEIDMPEETVKPVNATEMPPMKATGKKETVNGYAAEEWVANLDENTTMTMWLTSDIDKSLVKAMQTAMKAQNAQSPNAAQNEVIKLMSEKGMIAVRTTIAMTGETAAIVDLVRIEKATVADAMFTIPAGINVQKMPANMMQGAAPAGE